MSSARRSRRPRRHSRASSRCRYDISARSSRTSAARSPLRPSSRSQRTTRHRPLRISRTCAGRSARAARSRSLRSARTTCSSWGRRGRARRCWPAGSPASCRRSATPRRSKSRESTPSRDSCTSDGPALGSAVPGAAPRRLGAGHRRWRTEPSPRRGLPRPSRRAPPRRAAGVPALGPRVAAAATGGRGRRGRARRRARALPGSLSARRHDEHVPVRCPWRSGGRVQLYRRSALLRTGRSCRARSWTASTSPSRCLDPERPSSLLRPPRPRSLSARASSRRVRAWHVRRRCEPRPRRSCCRAPSTGCRCRVEDVLGSLAWRGRLLRSQARMSWSLLTSPSRSRIACRGIRRPHERCRTDSAPRSCVPAVARRDPRPAGAALPAGFGGPGDPLRAGGRRRRCPGVLVLRAQRGAIARPRARRCRTRRRERHGAWYRRRGAPGCARVGWPNRRRPRLRHRSRLSRRPRRTRPSHRRERPGRLGVRAGCRAGTLALPGSEQDHRRPLRLDSGRRGPRAKRCPHHGRLRPRGGSRRPGRTGRDHELVVGRYERAPQARGGAGGGCFGRARAVRARSCQADGGRARSRRRSRSSRGFATRR